MEASGRPALLVITPRFPLPAIGGDRLRISNIISHLARDFDVDVYSFYSDDEELADLRELQEICRDVFVHRMTPLRKGRNTIKGWMRGLPLQVAHYYSPTAQQEINTLVAERGYQAVLAHLVRAAEYARRLPAEHLSNERVVLELTDAISMNYYRIRRPKTVMEAIYLLERRRLLSYEVAASRSVAAAVVVAETDGAFFTERGAGRNLAVLTNGTDVVAPTLARPDRHTIAFLGNLRYAPNEDMVLRFARDVLPLVRRRRPDAVFRIIGTSPSKRVLDLHDGQSIVVTGKVDDAVAELATARVSVCPMRFGAGVQNKVLESLAVGVPVVSSTAGHEGIPAEPDREILIADDAAGFADQVVLLLEDDEVHARLSAAGREFIERNFRWEQPMAAYRDLLLNIAGAGRP